MKSLTLTFRKATPEDANLLEELINSSYRGDSARVGWTHESDLVGGLRTDAKELISMIGVPGESFLLAFSGDDLVGCVHLKDDGQGLYFGMLSVRPALQNARIGSALLNEIESRARREDKNFIRLSVIHLRRELIAYYERKGFRLTGRSESFPEKYPAKIPGLLLVEMKKTL